MPAQIQRSIDRAGETEIEKKIENCALEGKSRRRDETKTREEKHKGVLELKQFQSEELPSSLSS